MIKVRLGVFETNSSSTHTITMVPKRVFEEWKKGNSYLWNIYSDCLETEDEQLKSYEEWKKDDSYRWDEDTDDDSFEKYKEECLQTYEDWEDDEYLETYDEAYTTESGDEIVAFGKYGRD